MWARFRNVKLVAGLHLKHRMFTTLLELKPFNSKISTLMRSGLVDEAEQLFDEMPRKSTVTYNTMIRGYFENGFNEKAVFLYSKMQYRDTFTCNTMITGLMRSGDVEGAEEVFGSMGCRDVVTWNSLISGYFINERVNDAMRLFNMMPLKDVVSWNLVLGELVRLRQYGLAEELFREMSNRDTISWTIMLKAYLDFGRISEATEIFNAIPVKDIQAWNVMLLGYVHSEFLILAESFFHKMPKKDLSSWSIMVEGYISNGRINDALRLFNEMPEKLEKLWKLIILGCTKNGLVKEGHALLEKSPYSCIVSWTNIMIGYFRIGEVANALQVFDSMPARDTTVWNAAIFGLGENDHGEDGAKLLIRMKQNGILPDESTVTSFLTLCSNLPSLNLGKQIHAESMKLGINGMAPVTNALITMYCRCGTMNSALLEFTSMTCRDIISWNSIICGLAHHGHGIKAIEIFEQMALSDVKPNEITFVGVLSACSHAGLVQKGKQCFQAMRNEYNIKSTIEHYTCMVDLLGRCGLIHEAMDLLNQMNLDEAEVGESIWGALFGASRLHNNLCIAEIAGKKLLELDSSNSGVYMILAEMYLGRGMKEEAYGMWSGMKKIGVKKQPGCSWIESSGGWKVFLSGDRSHCDFVGILCTLNLIYWELVVS